MGRVYLKNEEALAVIEAIHNVEDTAGPLTSVHHRALAKLHKFGLTGKFKAKMRAPEQKPMTDEQIVLSLFV